MRYQTAVFVISVCATVFISGCKELPVDDCGPAELSQVPVGVTFVLASALSPNGIITKMTTKDGANATLICDDNQSISYGPLYREGYFNSEASGSSLGDMFIFRDTYECELYCRGKTHMGNARISKVLGVWVLAGFGTSSANLTALEDYLGPAFSRCPRGLISDSNFHGTTCAIVTDTQGITRYYPLSPNDPAWGQSQDRNIGELSLTEDEYFEWYQENIDFDSLQEQAGEKLK